VPPCRGVDRFDPTSCVRANAAQFAIEIGLRGRHGCQCLGDRRVFVRPIEPGAGQQPHRAVIEPGVHAVAVEFEFVKPIRPAGCLFDQLSELGCIHLGSPPCGSDCVTRRAAVRLAIGSAITWVGSALFTSANIVNRGRSAATRDIEAIAASIIQQRGPDLKSAAQTPSGYAIRGADSRCDGH